MNENPLAPPPHRSEVFRFFSKHFGLEPGPPDLEGLERTARAFARIPYENLTKIIKRAEAGAPERARRGPREVLEDHVRRGTGGTCFSLTALLLHLVRAQGWRAEPILADRRYGENTHCALLVWIDGEARILDPGYLIFRPVPPPRDGELRIQGDFNELLLKPCAGGGKVELHTIQNGRTTYRLTFKLEPADPGTFLRAWDASFDWDMMAYPVLTRVRGGEQLYLQENVLRRRRRDGSRRGEIPPQELPLRIAREFGIDPQVVARALEILRRGGDR